MSSKAFEAAGHLGAHAIWCLSDSDQLTPMLGVVKGGETSILRLVTDRLEESVQKGKQMLAENSVNAEHAALIYDGRITLDEGKVDAVVVEIYVEPPSAPDVVVALPYRPRSSDQFRVLSPQVVEWDPSFDVKECMTAFFAGIDSHEQGATIFHTDLKKHSDGDEPTLIRGSVQVNDAKLQQCLREYLDSEDGQSLLKYDVTSGVIVTSLALIAGIVLIVTVIGIKYGIKCLWYALTAEAFKPTFSKADRLKPVICPGVMVNPQAEPDSPSPGLVLVSLESDTGAHLDELSRLAQDLYRIYREGPASAQDKLLARVVANDKYRADAAIAIPEQVAKGRRWFACHANLTLNKSCLTDEGTSLHAFICQDNGENSKARKLSIHQIPWSIYSPAVNS